MAIELHGENFQSWERFDLHVEGLTVVVGPSNLGKSAITRLTKAILRNGLSAAQIRVGSDGVKGELTIDGHKVIAERSKRGTNTYNIDGKDLSKLGRTTPQELTDLGMGLIEIGKQKLDATFAGQFDSQFILDRSDEELNQILGAFSSTEQLEFGKRTANGRVSEKNAEAKVLAKNKQQINERILKLDALQVRADEIQTKIDALEPVIDRQQKAIAALESLIAHRTRLDTLRKVIASVKVPDTAPVAHSIQVVQAAARLVETRESHRRLRLVLKKLVVPDTATSQRSLAASLAAGQAAEASIKRSQAKRALTGIAACVTTWTEIVTLVKRGKAITEAEAAIAAKESSQARAYITRLDQHTAAITKLETEVKRLAAGIRGLDTLLTAREALEELRVKYPALMNEVKQAEALLEKITREHQEHQQAVAVAAARKAAEEERQRTTRTCPRCGETVKI